MWRPEKQHGKTNKMGNLAAFPIASVQFVFVHIFFYFLSSSSFPIFRHWLHRIRKRGDATRRDAMYTGHTHHNDLCVCSSLLTANILRTQAQNASHQFSFQLLAATNSRTPILLSDTGFLVAYEYDEFFLILNIMCTKLWQYAAPCNGHA